MDLLWTILTFVVVVVCVYVLLRLRKLYSSQVTRPISKKPVHDDSIIPTNRREARAVLGINDTANKKDIVEIVQQRLTALSDSKSADAYKRERLFMAYMILLGAYPPEMIDDIKSTHNGALPSDFLSTREHAIQALSQIYPDLTLIDEKSAKYVDFLTYVIHNAPMPEMQHDFGYTLATYYVVYKLAIGYQLREVVQ